MSPTCQARRGRHHALPLAAPSPSRSGRRHAAARERGVKLHHVLQRHPHAAQRHRQPRLVAGETPGAPRPAHRGQQPRRAQRLGQRHDGDVQRQLQRLARADRAAEHAVEVLRARSRRSPRGGRRSASRGGPAPRRRPGRRPAASASSRASAAPGHVDEALPRVGWCSRPSRPRRGSRPTGGRPPAAPPAAARPARRQLPRQRLERGLQVGVERGAVAGRSGSAARSGRPDAGQGRERGAAVGTLRAGGRGPDRVDQHAPPRRAPAPGRARPRAVGARSGRRVSGACGSATSSAASAGVRRGAPCRNSQARRRAPLEVAAKGRELQVERQDLVLGQPPLQRQRHAHLAQLAAPPRRSPPSSSSRATCIVRVEPPDDHAPVPRPPAPRRAPSPAGRRPVVVEPLVLVGQQHRQVARVDLVRGHRQPPAPVGHGIGAQQPPSRPAPRPRSRRPRAAALVASTQRSTRSRQAAAAPRRAAPPDRATSARRRARVRSSAWSVHRHPPAS
jgi:hypothetical protein